MTALITAFDRQFLALHDRTLRLTESLPAELLYRRSAVDGDLMMKLTVGENVIRSAAFIELTFGGITTRLWDDPFEWTLIEALNDGAKIVAYLGEVENTRLRAFGSFTSDADLTKNIPAPRELRPLGEILLDTIARAEHYQGRAFAIYQTLTSAKLKPR
ncbi:MAG: hypothetical protein ABJA02_07675 [Acidobacteriota bacterium]